MPDSSSLQSDNSNEDGEVPALPPPAESTGPQSDVISAMSALPGVVNEPKKELVGSGKLSEQELDREGHATFSSDGCKADVHSSTPQETLSLSAARSCRKRPKWVVPTVAVLVVGVVAASGAAYVSNESAGEWRTVALSAQAERDELSQELGTQSVALAEAEKDFRRVSAEMLDVQDFLEDSEADVGRLEKRVAELADEKAKAIDDAARADLFADSLIELTGLATLTVELFDLCLDYSDSFNDILDNMRLGYVYDQREIDTFVADMSEVCTAAEVSAERVEWILGDL